MKFEFPEVFTNKSFKYDDNEKQRACADGLTGWANCMMGENQPENFGFGMIKIGKILRDELGGKPPFGENLMALEL